MTPRLRTSVEGEMEQPSTLRSKPPTLESSGLGATTNSSVLLLFSLSKLDDIHVFISFRQSISNGGGS